jgi:hypothetical protein
MSLGSMNLVRTGMTTDRMSAEVAYQNMRRKSPSAIGSTALLPSREIARNAVFPIMARSAGLAWGRAGCQEVAEWESNAGSTRSPEVD